MGKTNLINPLMQTSYLAFQLLIVLKTLCLLFDMDMIGIVRHVRPGKLFSCCRNLIINNIDYHLHLSGLFRPERR